MTFDDSHIDSLAELLAEAARTEIMPRFRKLDPANIRRKTSRADLVTEADVASERLITDVLRQRYPEALVIGEEAVSDNPALLDQLAGAGLAFIIDPIDGTFNFAAGLPLFGVMLAVALNGEMVAGIIHDPVGGDWLLAGQGTGAFIKDPNGGMTPVHVAERVPLCEMTGSVSWQFLSEQERSRVAGNHAKCLSPMNFKCAAHEYRLLCEGRADFANYSKLMPWDHLAGILIHKEAGGYSAKSDGEPYRVGDIEGKLIVAPDEASWQEIKREIWDS